MKAGSIGVSVATGAIETTRTPWPAASRARLLVRVTTAPFEAAYACMLGRGRMAAVDAVIRKTPRRCFFITGSAYLAPSHTPFTLTAMMRSKIASSTSSTFSGDCGTPALAKNTSSRPQAVSAFSTISWLSAARVTSTRTASLLDLLDRSFGARLVEIGHDDPSAFLRHRHRRGGADPRARAGDHRDPSVESHARASKLPSLRALFSQRVGVEAPAARSARRRVAPGGAAVPAEPAQDDPAAPEHDTLLLEPDPLRHHAGHPRTATDPALRVHDAMPGHAVGMAHHAAHGARGARLAGERRELAVGRDAAARDPGNELEHGRIECHAVAPLCSS